MELYKGTPRLNVDECCKEFYDRNIFSVVAESPDEWSTFLGTVSRSVNEINSLFSGVDQNLLRREVTALGLEIFSIAYARKVKVDDLSWRQNRFTRGYLEERGRLDIWNIMSEYNQVVAQSGMDEQGKDKVSTSCDKMYRKWAKATKKERKLAKEEELLPDDYVVRAANLIGAEMKQADCITAERLAAKLAERLGQGTRLKEETLHKGSEIVFGFYRGAELYLKYISLHV
jgi:hypothetical protein